MDTKQRIEVADGPSEMLLDLREHFNDCVVLPGACPRCSLHRVAMHAQELNRSAERARTLGIATKEITAVLLAVLAEDVK